jgi:hypothetical protein
VKASSFEVRHATLLHSLLIAVMVATYLFERDDVVWRFIKSSPSRIVLVHVFFLIATLLVGLGAMLCTSGRVSFRPGRFPAGELLYAIGLASLAPLSGAIFFIAGESLRILRLALRKSEEPGGRPSLELPRWPRAFRREAAKWGIFITMIVFSITLIDRVADILASVSVLTWVILNLPSYCKSRTPVSAAS